MFDSLGKLQIGFGAAALAALGTFMVVSPIWFQRGYAAAELKATAVIASKNEKINAAEADISQCQTANASYFKQSAEQSAEVLRRLDANAQAVAQAIKDNSSADKKMLDAAIKSQAELNEARKVAANAVDQCIKANVPADYVELFNSAFRTAATSQANGNTGTRAPDH